VGKKREQVMRALFKNIISAGTKKEEKGKRNSQKIDPILERGGGVHVLDIMVVTFPTCHVERSPLKAPAD